MSSRAALSKTAVISNSDLAFTSGNVQHGLPQGSMHSRRKLELGRRNARAVIALAFPAAPLKPLGSSARTSAAASAGAAAAEATWGGPVLASATIAPSTAADAGGGGGGGALTVTVRFEPASAAGLHFHGAADCVACCSHANGSALALRVANASDATGFSWQRTEQPVVGADGVSITATFNFNPPGLSGAGAGAGAAAEAAAAAAAAAAAVDLDLLRFNYEGEPECALYNGAGGPDGGAGVAASPFFVNISGGGAPVIVPAPPCPVMLPNGTCFVPAGESAAASTWRRW
jgi:hypothetical protein